MIVITVHYQVTCHTTQVRDKVRGGRMRKLEMEARS
jgi:hypothetical protein